LTGRRRSRRRSLLRGCFSSSVVGVGSTPRAGLVRGVLGLVVLGLFLLGLILLGLIVVGELGLEFVELLGQFGEKRHDCGIV
jgi:hypothetical protein